MGSVHLALALSLCSVVARADDAGDIFGGGGTTPRRGAGAATAPAGPTGLDLAAVARAIPSELPRDLKDWGALQLGVYRDAVSEASLGKAFAGSFLFRDAHVEGDRVRVVGIASATVKPKAADLHVPVVMFFPKEEARRFVGMKAGDRFAASGKVGAFVAERWGEGRGLYLQARFECPEATFVAPAAKP